MKRYFQEHHAIRNILAVVLVLGLLTAGAGVGALFSDQSEISATVNSGTLDLRANGSNSIQPITLSNMKPTETKEFTWTLKNVGSVNGTVNRVVLNLSQSGGVYTDAEERAGDATNAGNLSAYLNFEAYVGGVMVGHGDLSGLSSGSASFPLNTALNADQEAVVTVKFIWPNGDPLSKQDNVCQGDSMTIDATVYMAQA